MGACDACYYVGKIMSDDLTSDRGRGLFWGRLTEFQIREHHPTSLEIRAATPAVSFALESPPRGKPKFYHYHTYTAVQVSDGRIRG
jgi:hypothetical protein